MGYEIQVSIPYFTNIPEDVVTNVLHFAHTGSVPGSSDFAMLGELMAAFYADLFPTSDTFNGMAAWMRPALTRMKIYDLDDAIPRAPKYNAVVALPVRQETSTALAPETSICLSLRATPISGIAPASQRGRIFLGGLGDECVTAGNTGAFSKPYLGFVTNCVVAADNLLSNSADAGWTWEILSRKLGVGFAVVGGFIDNALDTQRRRGNAPTSRTLWGS